MWTPEQADEHLINILDKLKLIKVNEVTILTGSNGSGKSLIRKAIPKHIAEQLNIAPEKAVGSTSMEQRTTKNDNWGALSSILMDRPDSPTSMNTWNLLEKILKQIDRYIVIDEPEIGASEELQLSFSNEINSAILNARGQNTFKGCLIITHSRLVVNQINHDNFVNLNGLSRIDWLHRIPSTANLSEIEHNSEELYHAVERRISGNRK